MHAADRDVLAQVMRILRDRADIASAVVHEGIGHLAAGRTTPLSEDLLAELATDPED